MTIRENLPLINAAMAAVSILWAGMLLGVSFLATPVKFQAPSLNLATALEVGRVTFAYFAPVEWGLASLLCLLTIAIRRMRLESAMVVALGAIVLMQAAWLLPALDVRVAAVIAGDPLPNSIHHRFYALLEGLKVLLAGGVGMLALCRMAGRARLPGKG